MASSNNLDTLSQDGELPFGHPGRRSDDTPEGFDRRTLMDQGPEPDYIHPGRRLGCGPLHPRATHPSAATTA